MEKSLESKLLKEILTRLEEQFNEFDPCGMYLDDDNNPYFLISGPSTWPDQCFDVSRELYDWWMNNK